MKTIGLGFLLAGLLLGSAATVRAAGAATALEGTWKVTAASEDGKDEAADAIAGMTMTVTGADYKIVKGGAQTETGTLTVGKEGAVDTVDFVVVTGEDKGKTQKGIYKVEADKAKLAYFEDKTPNRPTELASKAGQTFFAMEKTAAATPSPAAK